MEYLTRVIKYQKRYVFLNDTGLNLYFIKTDVKSLRNEGSILVSLIKGAVCQQNHKFIIYQYIIMKQNVQKQ